MWALFSLVDCVLQTTSIRQVRDDRLTLHQDKDKGSLETLVYIPLTAQDILLNRTQTQDLVFQEPEIIFHYFSQSGRGGERLQILPSACYAIYSDISLYTKSKVAVEQITLPAQQVKFVLSLCIVLCLCVSVSLLRSVFSIVANVGSYV